jgi:predicted DNA-binding protein (MmcQ/YjbR family)
LPAVTEDIKWGNDLCFLIGGKMFCITCLESSFAASFKVTGEEFEELTSREGFEPAPYMARAKWVLVKETAKLKQKDWEKYIKQSYDLVKSRLTGKVRKELKLE